MLIIAATTERLRRLLRRRRRRAALEDQTLARRLSLLMGVTACSMVVCSTLFWWFERLSNPTLSSFGDALWWWVVTSATVGYGDVVPTTTAGRLVTVGAIFTGFFVFTHLVAMIAESVHGVLERQERGTAWVDASDHIVVCEYTAIADEVIAGLENTTEGRGRQVVVVSDLVDSRPLPDVHFVQGVPFNPLALRKARIESASHVFIFANLRFADPDLKTLHIAARIRAFNRSVPIYVELVEPTHDLLAHCDENIVPLDSRQLIELVLTRRSIDPFALGRAAEPSEAAAGR